MKIETVKISDNGYLVNGNINVPISESNGHYNNIQKWISEGNTPTPKHTEKELSDQSDEEDYQEWKAELEAQKELDLRAQYELEKGL